MTARKTITVFIAALVISGLLLPFGRSFGETRTPDVNPAGGASQELPEDTDTEAVFLWMSDLQDCSYHTGEYAKIAQWCNRFAAENGASVLMCTGDMVGKWYSDRQWAEVSEFLGAVDPSLPTVYIAGNHDYRLKTGDFSPFLNVIYREAPPAPERTYQGGQGVYLLLTQGGVDWLIIGMSYGYGPEERAWIGSVLEQYPDRVAILILHEYLEASGRFTAPGAHLYNEIVRSHDNVRLILCGHNHGIKIRTDYPDGKDGRFVQSLMFNFQEKNSRRGSVQILTVDTRSQTVHLTCESPIKNILKPVTADFPLDLSRIPDKE